MASTGAGGLPAGHPAPGAATDEFEWTDLHHALADAGEFLPEAEVLQILDEHPDQANRPYAALFLPAHFAAAFYGTKRVNERVYELFPAAARAHAVFVRWLGPQLARSLRMAGSGGLADVWVPFVMPHAVSREDV